MQIFKMFLYVFFVVIFVSQPTFSESRTLKAPIFKERSLKGKIINSNVVYSNGPVIIDFWATWCVPCVAELKVLSEFYKKYQKDDLNVIAICESGANEVAKVKQFVRANKLPFTIIVDKHKKLSEQFNVSALPSTFFINKDGVIVTRTTGYTTGGKENLELEIVKLIESCIKE